MATEKLQLYKCNVCGNVVQVILSGEGELVCCGQAMELLVPQQENPDRELAEKHTPVIEYDETGKFVRLRFHPMINEHYIQFIEVYPKDKSSVHLKYLNPNDNAEFDLDKLVGDDIEALELCNIHGLWRSKNND